MEKKTEKIEEPQKLEMGMSDNTDPGSSSVTGFELPTGYLDDEGVLHKSIVITEMTCVEEDILTAKRMNHIQKIGKILENCIQSIGTVQKGDPSWLKAVRSLTASDRMASLIAIRVLSLGDSFSFKVKCPHCEKESNQTASLSEFKISGLPNPYERAWKGILPRSKKGYECKILTGLDEDKNAVDAPDPMTQLILSRLISLAGKKPSIEDVKKLSSMDRNHLRLEVRSKEGEIDNEIEIECPHCQEEFKSELSIGNASFFFP